MFKVSVFEGEHELIQTKVFPTLASALHWIGKMGASGVSEYTIEMVR